MLRACCGSTPMHDVCFGWEFCRFASTYPLRRKVRNLFGIRLQGISRSICTVIDRGDDGVDST
jgi:hypothetical protein